MQLYAIAGAWVSVEVEGQCFVNFRLPDPVSMEIALHHHILLETEFITQGSCDLLCLTKTRHCWSYFGDIFCSLKQSFQSITVFLRWKMWEHRILCELRKIISAVIGTEEQIAFWSRAQLHREKLIMLSHLILCTRRHVVYRTMQNKGAEAQGAEIMKVMLISNTSKQRSHSIFRKKCIYMTSY